MRRNKLRTVTGRRGRFKPASPAAPAPALTLAYDGTTFTWVLTVPNPVSWLLWELPTAENPTVANPSGWHLLDSNQFEIVDPTARSLAQATHVGFSYGLAGYDAGGNIVVSSSNLIVIPLVPVPA